LGFTQGRLIGDGDLFDDEVFLYTHDYHAGLLAGTQQKFDLFKAHVTKVTGIEL